MIHFFYILEMRSPTNLKHTDVLLHSIDTIVSQFNKFFLHCDYKHLFPASIKTKLFQLFTHNLVFSVFDAVSFYFTSVINSGLIENFKQHNFLYLHYQEGNIEDGEKNVTRNEMKKKGRKNVHDDPNKDSLPFFAEEFSVYTFPQKKVKPYSSREYKEDNPQNFTASPMKTRHRDLIEAILFALPAYYENMISELRSMKMEPFTGSNGIFEHAPRKELTDEHLRGPSPFPTGNPFDFFKLKYTVSLEGHNYPLHPVAVFWSIFKPMLYPSLNLVDGFQFSRLYIYSKGKPIDGWLYKKDERRTDITIPPLSSTKTVTNEHSTAAKDVSDASTTTSGHDNDEEIVDTNTLSVDKLDATTTSPGHGSDKEIVDTNTLSAGEIDATATSSGHENDGETLDNITPPAEELDATTTSSGHENDEENIGNANQKRKRHDEVPNSKKIRIDILNTTLSGRKNDIIKKYDLSVKMESSPFLKRLFNDLEIQDLDMFEKTIDLIPTFVDVEPDRLLDLSAFIVKFVNVDESTQEDSNEKLDKKDGGGKENDDRP